MGQFLRIFKYLSKAMGRDFSFSFWSILYPILMGTLFYFTLGNLNNHQLEPIPVAVADNSMAATIMQQVDLFEVTLVESDEVGKSMLLDKNAEAYIAADFTLNLKASTGIKPTIIRRVVNQIVQTQALGMAAMNVDFRHEYTQTLNQEGSFLTLGFYALLASICFYAMFNSLYMCTFVQPNLSELGARLAMTPMTKGKVLGASFLVSFLLNFLANLLFVVYVSLVLRISLFQEWGASLLILTAGNLAATAFGFAIGCSNRLPLEAKSNFILLFNLILSAFAGMMGPAPRAFIQKIAPALNEWNPIGIVTNTLMRVNRLAQTQIVWMSAGILLVYSIVAFGIAYSFLRRVQYDSV